MNLSELSRYLVDRPEVKVYRVHRTDAELRDLEFRSNWSNGRRLMQASLAGHNSY